ncbi:MAG TPA: hypothetical protein VLK82_07685 [Candidatus Tectomicrobia bacterium]|nr:hypothetical protein [Candidatus Tectomicrobia bacterium]
MNRHIISLSDEQLTPFDLDAFVRQAHTLNQRHRQTFTTPFPKAPSRWLSHYHFTPRPVAFTTEGDVEGGLSWLVGATIDFSFTRSTCAPLYGSRGGPCYDPASLVVLEVATKVDQYADYARFCDDLHQADKGRRYRELAGLHEAIPGEDDLSNFRKRVGAKAIEVTMALVVELFKTFGLIKGELLSTDGQLEPSCSRYKGCTYACQGCQQVPLDETSRQELCRQLQHGAKRLQLTCPFPDVVEKVRQATVKQGTPKEPKMALLEIEDILPGAAANADRQQVAALLGLPEDQVPSLRLKWCHVRQGPQGQLVASCPKRPSDLEAKVGHHMDTQNPSQQESIFGYVHQKTTDINRELGLELPLGTSTYPANANEGSHFLAHHATLPLPVLPGQVQLGDAAYDVTANYEGLHNRGAIAIFDYNRRNEDLSPEALVARGYDHHGTPYAPCGRLCRSNGYDYQADSRQYVCGRPCSPTEQHRCPHGYGVRGYSHRMTFRDHPRLIGPIQRGTPAWHHLYAARTASERTNGYDQEVIANGRPLRMRGLAAFRFAGAIRTLAQLLRRALTFVLDVTYTLGRLPPLQT